MKRLTTLYIVVLLASVFNLRAADVTEIVAQADSAYIGKEYFRAIDLYERAIEAGGPSSTLYYNIGNSYYRVGQPGQAILGYERALRVDPTNRAARLNLAFVNTKTADKTVDSGNIMIQLADNITGSMTADAWAWLTLGLFVLFLLLASGYIFLSGVMLRKTCFFGGIVVLLLTISGVIFSVTAARAVHDRTRAIVIVPKASLSMTPGRTAAQPGSELIIHEGHAVEIMDSVFSAPGSAKGKWYEVNLGNGSRAWIDARDVERVADSLL